LGELLAVTSGEMDGGDAVALGFADAYVPSARLDDLRRALAAGEDPREAVARVAEAAPASRLLAARTWWDPIAAFALGGNAEGVGAAADALGGGADGAPAADAEAESIDGVIRLLRALENDPGDDARGVAAVVRSMCPTSVAVTLAQIARTRDEQLSLAEVLADDLRVVVRLAHRPDFAEGVRAQVIEKDRTPKWRPARIEDLDPAEIGRLLAPLRSDEVPLAL
jgi:enoyl-CoA hydratase